MKTSKKVKLKPVIYIAGRYSDGGTLKEEERWKNRNIMRYFAIKFMKKEWAVLCPIENDEWAYEDGVITYEDTLSSDLAVINKCDAIIVSKRLPFIWIPYLLSIKRSYLIF